MNIAVLGIDLGKTLCSLVGLDREGAVVLRRRMRRHPLLHSSKSNRAASLAWRRAAALITSLVSLPRSDTMSG